MSATNAFNWREYTDEENARRGGSPFVKMDAYAKLGKSVTKGMDKVREKNPTHGTVFGLTTKRLNLKAPEMMETRKNAKTKK